ncbi:MAG: hypothetical protein IKJ59_00755 [Clostridia bacterium]|nr:hypothetical protein [Clostridia bacterium]
MKKETKKKFCIILCTVILYLVYLFSDLPRMDFIPSVLLVIMFLALGIDKYKHPSI